MGLKKNVLGISSPPNPINVAKANIISAKTSGGPKDNATSANGGANAVKSKTEMSELVGKAIAKKAKTKKIGSVVLDRNGSPYHGRVKAFAEAARKNGLEL